MKSGTDFTFVKDNIFGGVVPTNLLKEKTLTLGLIFIFPLYNVGILTMDFYKNRYLKF